MTTRILSGTVRHSDGTAWGHATLRVQKLALGTQPGEVYPMDGFNVTADANGVLPETALAVPETGAWLRRITFPDTTEIDFYLAAGAPISIDEIVALAEEAGSEAGTPQGEFLNGLYTAVSGADEDLLLQTESSSLALTNAPRGYWMQRTAVPEGETLTIPTDHQMIVYGEFTAVGDLVADGDLVIL